MKNKLSNMSLIVYISFFWSDLKSYVSCFLFPRQKWLTSKVPRTWQDKDELITNCVFECLKHYVEEEEGVTNRTQQSWEEDLAKGYVSQAYVDNHISFCKTVMDAYNYIVTERPALLKKLHDDYTIELEEEIFEKDTEYLRQIVNVRGYMWT